MIPPRLVLATANPGKVRELAGLVAEWGAVSAVGLEAFPDVRLPAESGTTYAENATLKAVAAARATGLPALGDDSGLEVTALDGGPGVRSARYAPVDAERIAKLLAALREVPGTRRAARFVCVVALAWPDGRVERAEGVCPGRIAAAPAGGAGFGYDPVFVADELGCTFAEASDAAKQRVSHRARAVRALGHLLAARNVS